MLSKCHLFPRDSNLWFRTVSTAFVTCVVSWTLFTGSRADNSKASVLEATRFVVKDDQGRERITLGMEKDSRAVLSLIDARGIKRVVLAAPSESNPYIQINDVDEKARIQLMATDAFATGAIYLFDRGDAPKARAILGTTVTGDPVLIFSDRDSKRRVIVALGSDGTPVLQTLGPDGDITWQAGAK